MGKKSSPIFVGSSDREGKDTDNPTREYTHNHPADAGSTSYSSGTQDYSKLYYGVQNELINAGGMAWLNEQANENTARQFELH